MLVNFSIIITDNVLTAKGEAAVAAELADNVIVEVVGLSGMVRCLHPRVLLWFQ